MGYRTITIDVPEYGWKISLFEPTLGEWQTIYEAWAAKKWDAVTAALGPLISKWDCTDRREVALEPGEESLNKLPMTVVKFLTGELADRIAKQLSVTGDPKGGSGISPTTQREPVATR